MLPTGRCWGSSIISEFIASLEGGPNCCVYPTPPPVLPTRPVSRAAWPAQASGGNAGRLETPLAAPGWYPVLASRVGGMGLGYSPWAASRTPVHSSVPGSAGWGWGHPKPREAEGHLVNWEERPLGSHRAGGTGPGPQVHIGLARTSQNPPFREASLLPVVPDSAASWWAEWPGHGCVWGSASVWLGPGDLHPVCWAGVRGRVRTRDSTIPRVPGGWDPALPTVLGGWGPHAPQVPQGVGTPRSPQSWGDGRISPL